ncbi:hypothetical protein NCS57_00308300 [Fusarium keratoplasticum]|uniref:Uncharacterized protein n=1 Tax=Fusarium keratoplasticum TaxID=1328300 RepID=A0ACC0RA48_9HYPO|nr:hypothetical protein NCS57_00308300 [Fusarium keratoplasticum]KAI8680282.1 hypothetical protein NCS57_00308300 [Fusarium keratoplasticum]KAI8686351.1 hypothetical protein NCS55_00310300 [Fusarium keratoplasticum]
MVRFAPLTVLALAPLAQARFDWLQPRGAVEECPPCPAEEACSHTVTITVPAGPQKTITVTDPQGGSYRTVTVQEPGESYTTVTVTQYNEPRTKFVYISQGETLDPPKETITITHPGKTVTVTRTESEEYIVTKKINVYPDGADYADNNDNGNYYPPGAKTVTVTNGYPAPSAGYPGYEGGVVTKVVGGNGGKYYDNAQTVTVVKDGEVKTLTFTHFNYNKATKTITQQNGEVKTLTFTHDYGYGNNNKVVKTITQQNGKEEVVTVTGDYKVVETITEQDGEEKTVTLPGYENKVVKTVTLEDGNKNKVVKTITVKESIDRVVTKTIKESGKFYTVIVTPEPTITTITKENGDYVTTVVEVPCTYTLTAPTQYETATVKGNSYKTITRTATYGSGSEVEVIVYDPKTGYSTCERKKDGQPCHPVYENDKGHNGDDDETRYGGDDKPQYGDNSKGQSENPAYTNTRGSNSSQTSIDVPNYTKVRPHDDDDNNAGVYDPEETDCDEAAVSTSIATVYNTVIVTVGGEPTTTTTQTAKQTLGYRDLESSNKRRSAVSVQW